MRSFVLLAALLLAGPLRAGDGGVPDYTLVMVDQPGCAYCMAWEDEIAPAYADTPEGAHAPLMRADLREGPPDGVTYARRVAFTPTFILLEDGTEVARMEGYVGQDFFWPLFSAMLTDHAGFDAASAAE